MSFTLLYGVIWVGLRQRSIFSLLFLLWVSIVAILWIRFLSIVEVIALLTLYLSSMLMLRLFIKNSHTRRVLERAVSILVDWYVGLKVLGYLRPGDNISAVMWTAFILFVYLMDVKKLRMTSL